MYVRVCGCVCVRVRGYRVYVRVSVGVVSGCSGVYEEKLRETGAWGLVRWSQAAGG